MKKSISVIAVSAVWLTLVLFSITGCSTSPRGEALLYTPPSRPALSSQQRENLTEADIAYLIERGDEEYEDGQFSDAKDFYYEVLLAMPEPGVYVLVSYGACLANLGSYENAIEIFNIALQKDPGNEVAQGNIAICRQYIAMETEQQRQFALEQQRQRQQAQEESFNNLIASLNSLSTSVAQVQQNQNQSGNTGGSTGGSSGGQSVSSGGSSSNSRDGNANEAGMRNNYNRRAKAAEDVYFQLQRANTAAEVDRLGDALRSHQRDLRTYREECKRRGVDIQASMYETAWPR